MHWKIGRRFFVAIAAVLLLCAAGTMSWLWANRKVLPAAFQWHTAHIYLKTGGMSLHRPFRGTSAPVRFVFPRGTRMSDVSVVLNGFEVLPRFARYADEETSSTLPNIEMESYVDEFTGVVAVGRDRGAPFEVTREKSRMWDGEYMQTEVQVKNGDGLRRISVDVFHADLPDI
jgi:hypothetical protein